MTSIDPDESTEVRHFMDDERQITIGVPRALWPRLQEIANQQALKRGWRCEGGPERSFLQIWIIWQVALCPDSVEPHAWISRAIAEI